MEQSKPGKLGYKLVKDEIRGDLIIMFSIKSKVSFIDCGLAHPKWRPCRGGHSNTLIGTAVELYNKFALFYVPKFTDLLHALPGLSSTLIKSTIMDWMALRGCPGISKICYFFSSYNVHFLSLLTPELSPSASRPVEVRSNDLFRLALIWAS